MELVPEAASVRSWMTRKPVTVPADCPIASALAHMRNQGIRHLLVEDGALIGIVSGRDLARLPIGDTRGQWLAEPVRRIMTEDPVTVTPDTPVTEAAQLLLESRIGALPVRDGEEIVGIFTTSDALEVLLLLLKGPRG
jgi:CBS domain-containing protein